MCCRCATVKYNHNLHFCKHNIIVKKIKKQISLIMGVILVLFLELCVHTYACSNASKYIIIYLIKILSSTIRIKVF